MIFQILKMLAGSPGGRRVLAKGAMHGVKAAESVTGEIRQVRQDRQKEFESRVKSNYRCVPNLSTSHDLVWTFEETPRCTYPFIDIETEFASPEFLTSVAEEFTGPWPHPVHKGAVCGRMIGTDLYHLFEGSITGSTCQLIHGACDKFDNWYVLEATFSPSSGGADMPALLHLKGSGWASKDVTFSDVFLSPSNSRIEEIAQAWYSDFQPAFIETYCSAVAGNDFVAREIASLAEMHRQGTLTASEFDAAKKKLLGL